MWTQSCHGDRGWQTMMRLAAVARAPKVAGASCVRAAHALRSLTTITNKITIETTLFSIIVIVMGHLIECFVLYTAKHEKAK